MTMRANRRRRNYQRNDGFNSQNPDRWHDITDHQARVESPRIGAYSVTARDGHKNSKHIPFRPEANQQKPHNPFANSKPPYNSRKRFHDNQILPNPAHNHFHVGSKRFKEYLLNSINQTLQQIQQWYPDHDEETTGNDAMDWQLERELLIPPPAEGVHYIWDTIPLPNVPIMEDLDAMGRSMKNEIPATVKGRRRVASEGYISVCKSAGVTDAWEIPRGNGFVSPKSGGPDTEAGA